MHIERRKHEEELSTLDSIITELRAEAHDISKRSEIESKMTESETDEILSLASKEHNSFTRQKKDRSSSTRDYIEKKSKEHQDEEACT